MTKWVYNFGAGHNEGGADMRNLLGGKGANLAEMSCPRRCVTRWAAWKRRSA
jgi:phosphoenolpyruvate synthase/pyruvate phosphate dikinase